MGAQEIIVGIGGVVVHHNPVTLTCLGLGSCVGVAMYDAENKIGGLAHVMLPDSTEYAGQLEENRSIDKLLKYADQAIPYMIKEMNKIGAQKKNMRAKIIGGAQMFPQLDNVKSIGRRNSEQIKKILIENGIPIDAEDLGGNCGRSMRLNVETQKIKVKTIKGEIEI